jgi:hypothetical protein
MIVTVADVLNKENLTVYSTCITSQITMIMPKNMNNMPRPDISADIFGSPSNHDRFAISRYFPKR